MRNSSLILATLLVVNVAPAQAAHENNIGLYVTPTPDIRQTLVDPAQATLVAPTAGVYDVYLVCSKPVNLNSGAPITTIRAYELQVVMPEDWTIGGVQLPPDTVDLDSDLSIFFVDCVIPVDTSRDHPTALLATLSIFNFAQLGAAHIHLAPIPTTPSFPDAMGILDGDDPSTIFPAYPSSGDFALPVLGINTSVVPAEDTTWSDVKALYR